MHVRNYESLEVFEIEKLEVSGIVVSKFQNVATHELKHLLFSKLQNLKVLEMLSCWKCILLEVLKTEIINKGIPSTAQHTDSHPCTRPPSWGTRGNMVNTNGRGKNRF